MKPAKIPKLRNASNGRSCVRCGAQDGTVVRCHYTGLRQHWYGKGTGIKGHDLVSADLCHRCHKAMDNYEVCDRLGNPYNHTEISELFLHYCMLTLCRDWEEGVIK